MAGDGEPPFNPVPASRERAMHSYTEKAISLFFAVLLSSAAFNTFIV